ncbi:helix-turn-helix transcriptional regulator [Oculatella sp. LEGE 06141]|uniref:helix-turn-helix domain-containing protein n=1 Tax=Oculatella sp. LEGE 06141 TaxID=1828648 RepID=UPI0018819528|nr:helix-turn-helix transcriptional regulator [Oculatella sp. LEGE 06141]MBE9179974.1 helix-turn-helix transcriptional regulator [Oculatella sp. LEGE 06141]
MLPKPEFRRIQQIAQSVRDRRDMMQLSQETFADTSGMTATINRWKNGRAKPSPLTLKQIDSLLHQMSQALNVALRVRQAIRNKYFWRGMQPYEG